MAPANVGTATASVPASMLTGAGSSQSCPVVHAVAGACPSRQRRRDLQHAPASFAQRRAMKRRAEADLVEQRADARFLKRWRCQVQVLPAPDAVAAVERLAAVRARVVARTQC